MNGEDPVPKVAVIGANGQVAAELCLLLRKLPGIDLVPVCRNPSGSAFLRYSGIACRHGLIADSREAPRLIGDCDVIVNCALGTGTPSEIRAFDRNLLHNLFASSPEGAVVIHCSTLMVHGDPRPGRWIRYRNPYGRAKLAAEGRVRAESRRFNKPGYTLRLGHVCGPLQNISNKIRREIAAGQVVLPDVDTPSNTVYTVTIVDAIASILAGKERPGAYDLTNVPQWSWRQVYDFEGRCSGQPFQPSIVPRGSPSSFSSHTRQMIRATLSRLGRTESVRQTLEKCLALAPKAVNDRAQATWYRTRARAEIAALAATPTPSPELSWIRMDIRPLSCLRPTEVLIADGAYARMTDGAGCRWPKDLPIVPVSRAVGPADLMQTDRVSS
jgi:nucleoside-diphosphate-sugar epimerase